MKLFKGRKAVSFVLSAVMILSSVSFSGYKFYAKEPDTTEITSEEVTTETSEEVPESTEAEQVTELVTTEVTTQETNPSNEVKGSQVDEAELTLPEKVEKGTIRYVEMKQDAEKISFFKQTLTNVEYRKWFYKLSDEDVKKYFGFEKREDFQAEVIYLLLQKEPQEYVKEFTEEEDNVFFGITKEEVLKFFEVATESDASAEENTEDVVTTKKEITESTTDVSIETTESTEAISTEEVTTEETASDTDAMWERGSLEGLLPFKSFMMLNDELNEDSMVVYGAPYNRGDMLAVSINGTNYAIETIHATRPCVGLLHNYGNFSYYVFCGDHSKESPFNTDNTGTIKGYTVETNESVKNIFWNYTGCLDNYSEFTWIEKTSGSNNFWNESTGIHSQVDSVVSHGGYVAPMSPKVPRTNQFYVTTSKTDLSQRPSSIEKDFYDASTNSVRTRSYWVHTGTPPETYIPAYRIRCKVSVPAGVVIHYLSGGVWHEATGSAILQDQEEVYFTSQTNQVGRITFESWRGEADGPGCYTTAGYVLRPTNGRNQPLCFGLQERVSTSMDVEFKGAYGWLELTKDGIMKRVSEIIQITL